MRKIPIIAISVLIAALLLDLLHLKLTYVGDGEIDVNEFAHIVIAIDILVMILAACSDIMWYEFSQMRIGKVCVVAAVTIITATIVLSTIYSYERWLSLVGIEILMALIIEAAVANHYKLRLRYPRTE